MARRRKIYEGKAKILYEGPEPGTLVQYFKDDATAFNAKKKGVIAGKGVINNRISEHLMTRLSEIGVPTHFVRRLNMREQLVRDVEIRPVEVVVRNVVAGSLEFGMKAGQGGAMNVATEAGFGTVSSSLIALPAAGRTDVGPVWLFAAGPPGAVPFDSISL